MQKNKKEVFNIDDLYAKAAKQMDVEIKHMTRNLVGQEARLPAKDPEWLKNVRQIRTRDAYNTWKDKTIKKYPGIFQAVTAILQHRIKNDKALNLYNIQDRVITGALAFGELAYALRTQYSKYKEPILAAFRSMAKQPTLFKEQDSISMIEVGTLTEKGFERKYFAAGHPALLCHFLYNMENAKKRQKDYSTANALATQAAYNYSERQDKIESCFVGLYCAIVTWLCEDVQDMNERSEQAMQSIIQQKLGITNTIGLCDAITANPYYEAQAHLAELPTEQLYDELIDGAGKLGSYIPFIFIASKALHVEEKSLLNILLSKVFSVYLGTRFDDVLGGSTSKTIVDQGDKPPEEPIPCLNERIMNDTMLIQQYASADIVSESIDADNEMNALRKMQETVARQKQEAEQQIAKAKKDIAAAEHQQHNVEKELEDLRENKAVSNDVITDLIAKIQELEGQLDAERQKNGSATAKAEKPQYPIRTKKKIIIYGGHPTWTNPMRDRFPDCTFMTGQSAKKYDAIPGADCLVFQHNALSHSSYGSAKNTARRYGVPILYFGNAGVEPSSEYLASVIQKIENKEVIL